jgi:hypothetical protein
VRVAPLSLLRRSVECDLVLGGLDRARGTRLRRSLERRRPRSEKWKFEHQMDRNDSSSKKKKEMKKPTKSSLSSPDSDELDRIFALDSLDR